MSFRTLTLSVVVSCFVARRSRDDKDAEIEK